MLWCVEAPGLSVQKFCISSVKTEIRELKSTRAKGPEMKLVNLHLHLMSIPTLEELGPGLSGLAVYKMQHTEVVYPINLH